MHVTWAIPQARADQGTDKGHVQNYLDKWHIIIIIIIIILVIAFMQGADNNIPETNRVSRVSSVTAVLYLQSVLHVMLFCL
jgi:hypothetical protein